MLSFNICFVTANECGINVNSYVKVGQLFACLRTDDHNAHLAVFPDIFIHSIGRMGETNSGETRPCLNRTVYF